MPENLLTSRSPLPTPLPYPLLLPSQALRALGGATLFAQTLGGDQFDLALPAELPAAGLDLVALLAAQHPDSEDLAPGEFRLIASDDETVVSPLSGAAALKMQSGEITDELMLVFNDPDEAEAEVDGMEAGHPGLVEAGPFAGLDVDTATHQLSAASLRGV